MTLALLLLYVAVIVGFLWRSDVGGVLGVIALILDLADIGGRVNI